MLLLARNNTKNTNTAFIAPLMTLDADISLADVAHIESH